MSHERETKQVTPDSADVRAYILEKLTELAAMAETSTLSILAERIQAVTDLEDTEDPVDQHREKPREAG